MEEFKTPPNLIQYEFAVLQEMISYLPDEIRPFFEQQFIKIITTLQTHFNQTMQTVLANSEDIELAFKAIQFDLDCTRNERDAALGLSDGSP